MIAKAQIISFHCVLKDSLGTVISKSFNQGVLSYFDGKTDILPGLMRGLQGIRAGEHREIYVPAEEAYGFYDPGLVIEVSRKQLVTDKCIEAGAEVLLQDTSGQVRTYRVTQASKEGLTLDGNHPLAGQDLIFDIRATSAREATQAEMAESTYPAPSTLLH